MVTLTTLITAVTLKEKYIQVSQKGSDVSYSG